MAASLSKRNSARALASSVLPTPVGPRNRNEPIGRFGSCKPGAAAPDGVGDRPDGVVLVHHPEVDLVFQPQQLLALGGEHPGDRHAGPLADDLGDLLGVDLLLEQPARLLGLAVAGGLGLGDPLLQVLPLGVELGELLVLPFVGPLAALLQRRGGCPCRASSSIWTSASRSRSFCMSPRPDFSISHWPRRSWSCFSTVGDLLLDLGQPLEGVLLLFLLEHPLGELELEQPALETSISVGTDWSSIDRRLAASSTRSIALSGRNRSVM